MKWTHRTPAATGLTALVLIFAVALAPVALPAQAPAPRAAPPNPSASAMARTSARAAPAPPPQVPSVEPRHHRVGWLLTAVIAAAAAVITGIIVYRSRNTVCGGCGNP